MKEPCDDCQKAEATHHYVFGAKRCDECAGAFGDAIRELHRKAGALEAERKAKHKCGSDDMVCEECCDHEFDPSEGYHCLDCGKDGSDEVGSRAYDAYKDHMKYGDM